MLENNNTDYDKFEEKELIAVIFDKLGNSNILAESLIFQLLRCLETLLERGREFAFSKNKAENQLKLKMLEKNISEETIIKIFKESNAIVKLQPLKWFLFTLAMAASLRNSPATWTDSIAPLSPPWIPVTAPGLRTSATKPC